MINRHSKLHIYLSDEDMPDGISVLHSYSEVIYKVRHYNTTIHTTQVMFCNTEMIFGFGYTIVVHTSPTEYFSISRKGINCIVQYSDPEKSYRKELRYASNLLKLLIAGNFCDMDKYKY